MLENNINTLSNAEHKAYKALYNFIDALQDSQISQQTKLQMIQIATNEFFNLTRRESMPLQEQE